MAFTEQATLKILDASTKPLNAINAAMEKVLGTSNKLNGKRATLTFTATGIDAILGKVRQVEAASRRPMVFNMGNVSGAASQLNALTAAYNRAAAAAQRLASVRPPTVPPIPPNGGGGRGGNGGGGGGGGGGPLGTRGFLPTYLQHTQWQAASAAHNVARSASTGMLEGATQRTLTALDQEFAADAIARSAESGASEYRQSSKADITEQVRQLASQFEKVRDANGNLVPNVKDIEAVGPTVAKMQTGFTIIRGNAKEASQDVNYIRRGLDAIGRADNAEKFSAATDAVLAGAMQGGRGWKAQNFESALKNAGRAKFGMNDQALIDFAGMTDEYGMMAGQMTRQFVGDLTRSNLHDAKKEKMAKVGLRNADGSAKDDVAKRASENQVDFILSDIKPIIQR